MMCEQHDKGAVSMRITAMLCHNEGSVCEYACVPIESHVHEQQLTLVLAAY